MDLQKLLPELMPEAIRWAEAQAARVARTGTSVNQAGIKIARAVGVARPELIRIAFVDEMPLPDEQTLRDAALETGLLGPRTVGVTFGHSVLIRRGYGNIRLYSHEFRHVAQYERFGSIAAFLQEYLRQIVAFGYDAAPLEIEARHHELTAGAARSRCEPPIR